jgi:hypothetical protein
VSRFSLDQRSQSRSYRIPISRKSSPYKLFEDFAASEGSSAFHFGVGLNFGEGQRSMTHLSCPSANYAIRLRETLVSGS